MWWGPRRLEEARKERELRVGPALQVPCVLERVQQGLLSRDAGEVHGGLERPAPALVKPHVPLARDHVVLLDNQLGRPQRWDQRDQVSVGWSGLDRATLGRGKRHDSQGYLLEVHLHSRRTQGLKYPHHRGRSSPSSAEIPVPDSRTSWSGARRATRVSTECGTLGRKACSACLSPAHWRWHV